MKLKLNPSKFRISSFGLPDAYAAYDPTSVTVGAAELQSGISSHSVPVVQVAGISPSTGTVDVVGNFFQSPSSTASGLIKSPYSTGALVDGATLTATSVKYPGCADSDITLANGQVWAACNVGATRAFVPGTDAVATCTNTVSDCNASNRAYLGGYYQWGRNDNLAPDTGSTTTLAPAGTLAGGVGHAKYIQRSGITYDWIATGNADLWGGSGMTDSAGTYATATAAQKAFMKGPCSEGYHVPTSVEWQSAVNSVTGYATGANVSDAAKFNLFVSTLKLPMQGKRWYIYGTVNYSAGGNTEYLSSVAYGASSDYLYGMRFDPPSNSIYPKSATYKDVAASVRCMKDY